VLLRGEMRGEGYFQDLWRGELEENRPLGRLRHRRENNIEFDLQVIV
jgi:hypothetical protein